ncbi:hypothetical protein HBI79_186880 [Parastagonospora nodorum]|nr:hypothetical protein HBI79_186880 [Parastagonospora nodorum]
MTTIAQATQVAAPSGQLHSGHDHLLPLLRTYFTLNLRADQKRTIVHQHLQHNRYRNVVHGPPYGRSEHWSRLLSAAALEFEGVEQEWRERDDGLSEDFEERVRSGIESLERLLSEMEGVE